VLTRDHTVLPVTHTFIHFTEWAIPAFATEPQSVTALWPVLIFCPAQYRSLSWPEWLLVTNRWFTRPQTSVTHPSTNQTGRRVTSLIETNALPLSQAVTISWTLMLKWQFTSYHIVTAVRVGAGVWAGGAADAQVGHIISDAVRLPGSYLCSSSSAGQRHCQPTETSLPDSHCPLCHRSAASRLSHVCGHRRFPSLSSGRQHLSNDDCPEDKREHYQNCSVLYSVWRLCTDVSSSECWLFV